MIQFTMANNHNPEEPPRRVTVNPDYVVSVYPAKDGIATTLTFTNGQALVIAEGFEFASQAIEKAARRHRRLS